MDYRIEDLFYGHHSGGRVNSMYRLRGRSAYFLYTDRVIRYLYVALYMDWTIIFRHPVNFFLLVTFFMVAISILFIAGFILQWFSWVSSCRKLFRSKSKNVMDTWMEISCKYY
jgi:hypothetical protein